MHLIINVYTIEFLHFISNFFTILRYNNLVSIYNIQD